MFGYRQRWTRATRAVSEITSRSIFKSPANWCVTTHDPNNDLFLEFPLKFGSHVVLYIFVVVYFRLRSDALGEVISEPMAWHGGTNRCISTHLRDCVWMNTDLLVKHTKPYLPVWITHDKFALDKYAIFDVHFVFSIGILGNWNPEIFVILIEIL